MIIRLLIAAVITMAGIGGVPTEYFESERLTSASDAEPGSVYFPETGQYLDGELLEFWWEFGGVPVFGFPVTGRIEQRGQTVQYFERAVLELHPDAPVAWRVQVRRLGIEAAEPRDRQVSAFVPGQAAGDGSYFSETGHAVSPRFLDHWESHGGVKILGFPISAEIRSNGSIVQYFERAVLEHFPEKPADRNIQHLKLGLEAAKVDGVDTSARRHDDRILAYHPDLWGQGGSGPEDRVVYLTFDDGPHRVWTPQVLEILRQYNASATFFILGRNAEFFPDLVNEIVNDGHVLANHTYDHSSMTGMSFDQVRWQLRATEHVTTHQMAPCMRPPYGAMDANTRAFAAELGYKTVLWDVDPRDWERPGAQAIADRILNAVNPGDVVLLHDGGDDRAQSVEALEIVLERLTERGYRFAAICQ